MKRLMVVALVLLAVCALSSTAIAYTVELAFYRDGVSYTVLRTISQQPTPKLALELLLQGPTPEEAADGVVTAIPEGTTLVSLEPTSDGAVIELSPQAITNLDELRNELIFRQFVYTLVQFGLDKKVRVRVGGFPLSSYLAPAPPAIYSAPTEPPGLKAPVGAVGLSGKRITLSPGHGYVWTGTSWGTQRGIVCGYQQEDFRNIDIATWLKKYLEQDGAYVQTVREHDKTRGNGPSGHPWWQISAYAWLMDAGYSCSVTASNSGVCSYTGAGVNHWDDDIRSRPLASNLDARGNTDILISIHTNAYNTTAKGTTVWYCDTGEHVPWGPASIQLCDVIGSEIVNAIQTSGEKNGDGTTWTCLGNVCTRYGDFGEVRLPQRPAALIELGFHDNCTADAIKLEEPFFQSVSMWGTYKAICSYLGRTPTWDMYSCEIVSDTIPSSMAPGETRSVSVTFRNRGVLWTSAKGFKLGAVGDSDPFTGTIRHNVATATGPGDTYTFTFNMTAPTSTGYYLTDWRMIREGYQWFGPTLSKYVNVGAPPDTEPPTVPTNLSGSAVSSTQINLSWTASTDNVGVAGYKIYRNSSFYDTSPTNSYSDSGCSPGTTYSYAVSAYDGANNESAQSAAICLTTPYSADIIMDEEQATYTGSWTSATGPSTACWQGDYKYSIIASSETATAIWRPTIEKTGNYNVYVQYRAGSNRTQFAPYTIYFSGGSQTYRINQEINGGTWVFLATKPFSAGTTGYVKLGNNASDIGEAVIADAVRFTYASGPPSAPSDLLPVANSTTSITWKWCDLPDETGYRVKDTGGVNKSGDLSANTTQWTEGSLTPNTQYTRIIYAFNASGESGGSTGQTKYTLAKAGESTDGTGATGNVYCTTASKNQWYGISKTFTFSNPAGFGTGGAWKASKFEYKWNKSATETWATAGTTWSSGTILLTANAGEGDYYLHVRAFNAENVANNTDKLDYGPFRVDGTPPSAVSVTDEGAYTPSLDTLKASWTASTDTLSGLNRYEYAVGTSSTTQNVRGWTSNGTSTSVTISGLSLVEGTTYYVQARAVDNAGNTSTAASADGILAAPGVTRISSAWSKTNGTEPLSLRNKLVTAKIGSAFWLQEEDRSSAIKVTSSASVSRGNRVSVAGVLGMTGAHRALIGDVVVNSGGSATIAPLAVNQKALLCGNWNQLTPGMTDGRGLYNIGLLVKCAGKITYVDTTDPNNKYFYFDDGSGLSSGGRAGVKVWCGTITPPATGMVVVTGILSSESIGGKVVPVLLVRETGDILAL